MSDDPLMLRVDGPLVDAEVADPDRPQSSVIAVRMLVDTGAELSVLPRDVVDALSLARTREVEIAGIVPKAFTWCPVFTVIVHVGGGAFEVDVAALPRDEVAGGIVGRDLLSHLVFTYDGPPGVFGVTTPGPTGS
jgi:predicted aspartyl protease